MELFLSCDWGTSAFRLRLIRVHDLHIVTAVTDNYGIADCYRLWSQQHTVPREEFYIARLKSQIGALGQKAKMPLDTIPVVLSGMASSSIGLMELPYKKLPFDLDGSDLLVDILNAGNDHPLIIISGTRTDNDVMRGEETKVLGWASALGEHNGEQLLILPGTHPKHIAIRDNQAVDFKTYMTGEFFDLLANRSVLSASVEAGGDFENPANQTCFCEGVEAGQAFDLLHMAFMVRTNQLIKQTPKTQNFYYLSGLLIGAELKQITSRTPVCLVGGQMHSALYARALQILGVPAVKTVDADSALIRGQQVVFSTHYFS